MFLAKFVPEQRIIKIGHTRERNVKSLELEFKIKWYANAVQLCEVLSLSITRATSFAGRGLVAAACACVPPFFLTPVLLGVLGCSHNSPHHAGPPLFSCTWQIPARLSQRSADKHRERQKDPAGGWRLPANQMTPPLADIVWISLLNLTFCPRVHRYVKLSPVTNYHLFLCAPSRSTPGAMS